MIGGSEAATMKRRYLLMATSIFGLDLAIDVSLMVLSGALTQAWLTVGMGVICLLLGNFLVSRWLCAPIAAFHNGRASFDSIQRMLTQLPLLTARTVGIL